MILQEKSPKLRGREGKKNSTKKHYKEDRTTKYSGTGRSDGHVCNGRKRSITYINDDGKVSMSGRLTEGKLG